ncbi:MAG TPA: 3-deoxy-7-phosphoheptulonate synthase [Planctomycetota bacterium]|nr:3-deoxy-7-phosphoheptulonate synthase [Planctomycetota bacterium]
MLVILRSDCTAAAAAAVEDMIRSLGYRPVPVPGANRTAICVTGNKAAVDGAALRHLPGVLECIAVTRPYKLVSREVQPEDSVITVADVRLGGDAAAVLIAGPCSVETEARTLRIAEAARTAGARMFRAGAFKPRTSPYDFQGLGHEALHTLSRVREEFGLPVVSEVLDKDHVAAMAEHVDVLQVGARNMQNFALLRALAGVRKPVLLKRGASATLTEWLMAAEYLLAGGNDQVILCERGIRTFADHSRNTLDLNVVPLVRQLSHLPVVVDPSHGVGARDRVRAMARAAIACGAQGLLVEAHFDPSSSYTDADQTVDLATLQGIARDLALLGKLEPL